MVYMYTTYWTFVAFSFFDHISPANSLSTALRSIRIGTRPSPLAKIQANAVADALRKVLSTNQDGTSFDISILDILATGDEIPAKRSDVPLAVQLVDFTGTLDEALLAKEIDIAVHSLKDIPPSPRWVSGIEIAACLERENPGDVLVSLRGNQNGNGNGNGNQNDARNESQGRDGFKSIQSLPQGARVGTSSVRRQAQLLHLRKDLELINLRGSVGARITSLEEGTVDVLILAKAGLNRLLLKEKKECRGGESSFSNNLHIYEIPQLDILSGCCQGIIAATCRSTDQNTVELLRNSIDVVESRIAATAERAFLDTLDSFRPTLYKESMKWSGRPPLAACMKNTSVETSSCDNSGADEWTFRGILAKPDGSTVLSTEKVLKGETMDVERSRLLGIECAQTLLNRAGPSFYI